MLETTACLNLYVHLYCTNFESGEGWWQADELLDSTLTSQQKCIALTFDVCIDPMY